MLIICSGMNRSGSTLVYNIAKNILELKDAGESVGIDIAENDLSKLAESKRYHLIKVHGVPSSIEKVLMEQDNKILFSYRDVRDVIVSYMLKYNRSFIKVFNNGFISSFIHDFNYWNDYEGRIHKMYYSELYNNSIKTIKDIADFLGILLEAEEINEIAEMVKRESLEKKIREAPIFIENAQDTYDKDTLIHKNHFNTKSYSSFKSVLRKREIARVEHELAAWITEFGDDIMLTRAERSFYNAVQKGVNFGYRIKEKLNL